MQNRIFSVILFYQNICKKDTELDDLKKKCVTLTTETENGRSQIQKRQGTDVFRAAGDTATTGAEADLRLLEKQQQRRREAT